MSIPISRRPKRVCALLILTLLLAALLTLTVSADTYVGRYDGRVAWSFNSGTGELRVYDDCGAQTPLWSGFADQISSVYIAPGVTQLPRDAFRGCRHVREIIVPDTVTSIGAFAFADCAALSTLVLPGGLRYVGEYLVSGCPLLSYVTYRGSSEQWDQLCVQASTLDGNEWLCGTTPVYTRRTHLVTVRYVSAETGDELSPAVEKTVTEGSSCTIPSPAVERHSPGESAVVLRDVRANQSVTVLYYRTHCEVTVRYVDEHGIAILPDGRMTVAQGSSLLLQAPEIEGYVLPAEAEVVLTGIMQNDTVHTFRYTKRMLTVRVRCVDEQGQELIEPLTVDVAYRGDYDIPLPLIDGYTVGMSHVRGTALLQSTEQTVTYSPVYHTVTLHYVDGEGSSLSDPDVLRVRHGQALAHTVKTIVGYEAQSGQLSVAAVKEQQTFNVVYRPAHYLLTVEHRTTDGVLLTQTSEMVAYKQSYRCTPLPLVGYEAIDGQSEQMSGIMGASPLTLTVYYRVLPSGTGTDTDTVVPWDGVSPITLLWVAVGVGGAIMIVLCAWLVHDIKKRRGTAK